ncbi:MAG: hypothetical protein A2Z50_00075 [Nitrospirae bacterium RBG_19FT_COMBO_42_15]|nr:MAG: hypothetical protein A2Z50_00075 [Nitrospirae bacterium RBG_19FT_COMBO_42_15]
MLKTQRKTLSGYALREAGWNALVKDIGLINATRFILQYESGYGDYTKIKKELFKGKSVTDICKELEKFEKSGFK